MAPPNQQVAQKGAQTPKMDATSIKKALCYGLDSIEFGRDYNPGTLKLNSPSIFPIFTFPKCNEVFLAATEYEKGRIIAMTHNFILGPDIKDPYLRFLINTIQWLTHYKQGLITVMIYWSGDNYDHLLPIFKQFNLELLFYHEYDNEYDNELRDFGVDLIILPHLEKRAMHVGEKDLKQIDDFVINGGGILSCGLGWVWNYYGEKTKNTELKIEEHFMNNIVLKRYGILYGDGYVDEIALFEHLDPDYATNQKKINASKKEIKYRKIYKEITWPNASSTDKNNQRKNDIKSLLKGLDLVDYKEVAFSNIKLLNKEAFSVLSSDNEIYIAASRYGKGRVIYFTHDFVFGNDHFKTENNKIFFGNIVKWLANKEAGFNILYYKESNADWLTNISNEKGYIY